MTKLTKKQEKRLRSELVNLAYKIIPLPSGCSNCWGDLHEGCTDECRRSRDEHSEKIDLVIKRVKKLLAKELDIQRKEIIEDEIKFLERVSLDMEVVVCECGEPYKDTDPHNYLKERIEQLKQ